MVRQIQEQGNTHSWIFSSIEAEGDLLSAVNQNQVKLLTESRVLVWGVQ